MVGNVRKMRIWMKSFWTEIYDIEVQLLYKPTICVPSAPLILIFGRIKRHVFMEPLILLQLYGVL